MKSLFSRHRKFLLVATLATAAFALLTGFAGKRMHDPERMQARMAARIDKALDEIHATDAQRTQILAIRDRVFDRMKGAVGKRTVYQQFMVMWEQDKPDAKALHQAIDEAAEQRRQLGHELADAMIEVHQILTPEQRAQVAQMMKQGHGRMGSGKRGKSGKGHQGMGPGGMDQERMGDQPSTR